MKRIAPTDIDLLIASVRGQKVILDADLAKVYQVPTKALNQAVKRNREKFPRDFLFQLTPEEASEARNPIPDQSSSPGQSNRSQSVTGSQKHRDPRYLPYAFTEHGAIMAANVLNPPPPPPEPTAPEIGFHIKEDAAPCRTKRKTRRL